MFENSTDGVRVQLFGLHKKDARPVRPKSTLQASAVASIPGPMNSKPSRLGFRVSSTLVIETLNPKSCALADLADVGVAWEEVGVEPSAMFFGFSWEFPKIGDSHIVP